MRTFALLSRWLGALAVAWAVTGAGLATAAGVPAQALHDDRGRPVTSAQPVQRIVSLLPSLTETVCVLGACDRLVGVDRYSNWPNHLLHTLPVVGGGLDPNIEAIVSLKPDVVLMSDAPRVVAQLEALGLRTVALEPHTQEDVQRITYSVGALLGLPPQVAQQQWQRIQAGLQEAAQLVPEQAQGAKVYFEVSRGPFVAGPTSFIGELLTGLKVGNVVPAAMGPFPRLNPEFILRARPDVILMGNHSMQVAHTYPGWASLEAVQQQRVCAFNAEESGIIVRPGPRMDEAARIMARCLAQKAPQRAS